MKHQWNQLYSQEKNAFVSPIAPLTLLKKKLKRAAGVKVLDLGCGVGLHAIDLAKCGYRVSGLDISPKAIKLASKNAKDANVNINFTVGSMKRKLPFKSSFFDGVVCLRVLNHGTDSEICSVINEIYRVLKPNGYVVISVQKIFGRKVRIGMATYNTLPVEIIAPYTYIPREGKEKGVIHYSFTKQRLIRFFSNFQIEQLQSMKGNQSWENYYYFVGRKR
ncbi:class I SAM-dependent methyltransferase [Candidatus Collierbacteria bacterium]|nr:class I SAM-dependent methyltransferase [Candidatus Collierbacteria bacterium]